jgi:hypothetical protein
MGCWPWSQRFSCRTLGFASYHHCLWLLPLLLLLLLLLLMLNTADNSSSSNIATITNYHSLVLVGW